MLFRSLIVRKVHAYGASPFVNETTTYGPDGRRTGRIVYERDAKDNLAAQKQYNAADVLTERRAYQTDSRGLLVEESEFDGAGKLRSVTRTTYDLFP